MGAGRTEASFTFKSRPSFSKIKQIYGEHLEGLHPDYPKVKTGKSLDPKIRQQIKNQVKTESQRVLRRQIMVGTVVAIATLTLALYLSSISNFEHFLTR